MEDMTKVIMNPSRMRIIQYLLLYGDATTAQIGEELTDISQASLYRHIKILEKAGVICVSQERRVRGTVQKVYEMNLEMQPSQKPSNQEISQLINGSLFAIMGAFSRYLANENNDISMDMLCLTTSTLMLDDGEFADFMMGYGELIHKMIENKPDGKRKIRRMTIISSPGEE